MRRGRPHQPVDSAKWYSSYIESGPFQGANLSCILAAVEVGSKAMDDFEVSSLNKVRRSDRGIYDRAAIHALLDEAFVAHVGFIAEGRPIVLPMVYGRMGDILYIHGAKAARFAKALAQSVPVCLTVTLVDGIVVARSAFHMSANYRSAVLHGTASLVTDPA